MLSINEFDLEFSLKLAFWYAIAKLKFIHFILPQKLMYRYDKGEIDYPIAQENSQLIEVKAGQFFLFSERVIHGAVPNKTDSSRWAVNCRIAKTSTRFFTKEMLEKGHHISYHKLKNISLDRWRAVLLRDKDRFGYNPLLKQ